MQENYKNLTSYSIYKKAIWLFLILLIFEGAIRKWFLPSLSLPLLVIRDPIVVWLVIVGFNKGWLKNFIVPTIMVVSTLSLLATLLFGHQNLYTALFGWRIYFFYFPFIFVMGRVLTREDVLKFGKFLLYLSIPMTILIVIQFYSPQSAWVNRGVGGDIEGAGMGGALGYYRPPGTFSFISGFTSLQLLVSCFLVYFIIENKKLLRKYQINNWSLALILFCFLVTIPYSISRTHFFQTIVIIFITMLSLALTTKFKALFKLIGVGVIVLLFIGSFSFMDKGIEVFNVRFEDASESEGGLKGTIGDRYFGSILRGFDNDFPFWGYGIGYGSNVGAKFLNQKDMYSKFNSDQEWVKVLAESGIVLGFLIMLMRTYITFVFFLMSIKLLLKNHLYLPLFLSAAIFIMLLMGTLNPVTHTGFAVFIAGLALAFIQNNEKTVIYQRLSRFKKTTC